jgi:hypothetical protein
VKVQPDKSDRDRLTLDPTMMRPRSAKTGRTAKSLIAVVRWRIDPDRSVGEAERWGFSSGDPQQNFSWARSS